MARLNVYVPDDLAAAARKAELNVSALTQQAIRDALDEPGRRTTEWLKNLPVITLKREMSEAEHQQLWDDVKAEFDW